MSTGTQLQWSTKPAAVTALAVGGAVLAVAAAVVVADAAGQVLVGFAAIVALATAALALRQRPRLAVLPDSAGIAVTRLTGRRKYTRPELQRVRLVDYPRLGRRVPMLEIDTRDPHSGSEQLMIFGRWDLGADPRDVYDALASRGLAPDQTPS